MTHLTLRFDGACSNNGRVNAKASWGWMVFDQDNRLIAKGKGVSKHLIQTNNTAEYEALIVGLRWLSCLTQIDTLRIEGDSKLVLETLIGNWRIKKNHIRELRETAYAILGRMDTTWEVNWIPREQNSECDAISR